MPDASTFALFVAASLALTIVPGPAVFYIVARSVEGGRPAGLVSVLGIGAGGLVHVLFAAVGLSAILVSSAAAFSVVKWLGAAYLVYLGLQRILARDEENTAVSVEREPLSRVFSQGVIVNVLNPKTALFFFAFLPQFVDVSAGRVGVQILILGCLFILLATLSDGTWAVVAGAAGAWLHRRPGFVGAQRWVSGSVFLGLGVATALSGARASQPPP